MYNKFYDEDLDNFLSDLGDTPREGRGLSPCGICWFPTYAGSGI